MLTRNLLFTSIAFLMAVAVVAQEPKTRESAEKIEPPKQGVAVLSPTKGNQNVRGTIMFQADGDNLHVRGRIRGLTPGKHGFHVHEYGDLRSNDGTSAGGHFNPENTKHGAPDDPEHHAGDFGNIEADENGVSQINMTIEGLKLHFILGRALVVHAKADDLKSQPSGDAGDRVALGVIGIANPEAGQNPRSAPPQRN